MMLLRLLLRGKLLALQEERMVLVTAGALLLLPRVMMLRGGVASTGQQLAVAVRHVGGAGRGSRRGGRRRGQVSLRGMCGCQRGGPVRRG